MKMNTNESVSIDAMTLEQLRDERERLRLAKEIHTLKQNPFVSWVLPGIMFITGQFIAGDAGYMEGNAGQLAAGVLLCLPALIKLGKRS